MTQPTKTSPAAPPATTQPETPVPAQEEVVPEHQRGVHVVEPRIAEPPKKEVTDA